MTAAELRDREIEASTKAIVTTGEILGLTEAHAAVLNARDLADARGAIEALLVMAKFQRAGFDTEARNAAIGRRILAVAEAGTNP